MTVGTKSVLFGAHAFWLHPFFVAAAWWKLFGNRRIGPLRVRFWDPRLWVAFFVHDLGYLGKPNMDGPEGEEHPRLGAKIMGFLFDGRREPNTFKGQTIIDKFGWTRLGKYKRAFSKTNDWHDFTIYHSWHFAKKYGRPISPLCFADKLASCLIPSWLYVPMVKATGEIEEYKANAARYANSIEAKLRLNQEELEGLASGDDYTWFKGFQSYMRRWVFDRRVRRKDGTVE